MLVVQEDVQDMLEQWSTHQGRKHTAAQMLAALDLLRRGCVEAADVILKVSNRGSIVRAEGDLRELGKNCKGGAPRVFLLRRFRSYFFVAAGVEQGSTGCPEIPLAIVRALAIVRYRPEPVTLQDFAAMVGGGHRVDQIPELAP